MRMISSAILTAFLTVPAARSEILMIQIDRTGTDVAYHLQGKAINTAQLKSAMGEVGAIETNLQVHIRTTPAVTASDLIILAALLKDSGLTKIVVWTAGAKNGKNGTYLMPMQLLSEPVLVCLREEKRDFIPEGDNSLIINIEPIRTDEIKK